MKREGGGGEVNVEKVLAAGLYDASQMPKAENQRDAVRLLIAQVRTNPFDDAAVAVLSDWCEEKGFDDVARSFRDGERGSHAFNKALMALRILFGDDEPETATEERLAGRYTSVYGFRATVLVAGSTTTLATQPYVTMRLRKIVLPSELFGRVVVESVGVGKNYLLHNSEALPAELFRLDGPELFDEPVHISQQVSITLTNEYGAELYARASALGLAIGFDGKPTLNNPSEALRPGRY